MLFDMISAAEKRTGESERRTCAPSGIGYRERDVLRHLAPGSCLAGRGGETSMRNVFEIAAAMFAALIVASVWLGVFGYLMVVY
jgi:hypothetical protein